MEVRGDLCFVNPDVAKTIYVSRSIDLDEFKCNIGVNLIVSALFDRLQKYFLIFITFRIIIISYQSKDVPKTTVFYT
jgi:hypothetical protein